MNLRNSEYLLPCDDILEIGLPTLEERNSVRYVLDSLPPFLWIQKQYLEPERTVGHI
jgi:hypothetical protein